MRYSDVYREELEIQLYLGERHPGVCRRELEELVCQLKYITVVAETCEKEVDVFFLFVSHAHIY